MRLPILIVLFFVVVVSPALASRKKSTDAEADGFKGTVKSVSTGRQVVSTPYPRQPDGPAIIYPVRCEVCDYDEDGNSIRRGQNWNTGFAGETTRYIRDSDGNLRQQVMVNEKGKLLHRVTFGAIGRTEEEFYHQGVPQSRNEYRYDESGNMIESLSYDADGVQIARTIASFDERGSVTEQFDYGPKNKFLLHYTQTYNPDTDVQTFTSFNEDGTVRVTFLAKESRVVHYWQQPSHEHEYGSSVCFDTGPKQRECESHDIDGTIWHTTEAFADEGKRNPSRIELRDQTEQVHMAADYEYEFDERGNWISRSVWVWTSDSGERRLLEVDSRTLAYWK